MFHKIPDFVVLFVGNVFRVNQKRLQLFHNIHQRQFILDVFADEPEDDASFRNDGIEEFFELVGHVGLVVVQHKFLEVGQELGSSVFCAIFLLVRHLLFQIIDNVGTHLRVLA